MNNKWLAIPFLLLATVADILLMQHGLVQLGTGTEIFRRINSVYQLIAFTVFPAFILLCGFGFKAWRFIMYALVGCFSGWLDILFYLLQGKMLPATYTWLLYSPTNIQLLMFAIIILAIAVMIDLKVKKK